MTRRNMIGSMAGAAVVTAGKPFSVSGRESVRTVPPLKGNIHHSVSQWCYGDIPLEDSQKPARDGN